MEVDACDYCGATGHVELVHDEINGIVSEADVFCAACRRHLGFFAYGSWLPGTGQLMTATEEVKAAHAARQLALIQRTLVA